MAQHLDEAPTSHREMFNAVDHLFQELLQSKKPFGGKPMLLGGDFRQIPPVMRYVERDAVSSFTLSSLPWWKTECVLHCPLSINMRAKEDVPYAQFCQSVGDGTCPPSDAFDSEDILSAATIALPPQISSPLGSTPADLLDWVYDGFLDVLPAQWPQFYEARSVLVPTNEAADELNDHMLAGDHRSVHSKRCSEPPKTSR